MQKTQKSDDIKRILRELGIGSNYRGYHCACVAVELALEDEDRLFAVTRDIYRPTAEIMGCNWTAVERNIRTVVQKAWRVNSARLIEMSGYPLSHPPTASEFLEIIVNYLSRK